VFENVTEEMNNVRAMAIPVPTLIALAIAIAIPIDPPLQ
jgi:hypothetical protein